MIPKNENIVEEMVSILEVRNQYIPEVCVSTDEEDQYKVIIPFQLPLAGDMLTAARARTALDIRVTNSEQCALQGIFHFSSDWQSKFHEGACKCTLYVCVCTMYVYMYVWMDVCIYVVHMYYAYMYYRYVHV